MNAVDIDRKKGPKILPGAQGGLEGLPSPGGLTAYVPLSYPAKISFSVIT